MSSYTKWFSRGRAVLVESFRKKFNEIQEIANCMILPDRRTVTLELFSCVNSYTADIVSTGKLS